MFKYLLILCLYILPCSGYTLELERVVIPEIADLQIQILKCNKNNQFAGYYYSTKNTNGNHAFFYSKEDGFIFIPIEEHLIKYGHKVDYNSTMIWNLYLTDKGSLLIYFVWRNETETDVRQATVSWSKKDGINVIREAAYTQSLNPYGIYPDWPYISFTDEPKVFYLIKD